MIVGLGVTIAVIERESGEANKTSIPQKLNASLPHLNLDNDSLKS